MFVVIFMAVFFWIGAIWIVILMKERFDSLIRYYCAHTRHYYNGIVTYFNMLLNKLSQTRKAADVIYSGADVHSWARGVVDSLTR